MPLSTTQASLVLMIVVDNDGIFWSRWFMRVGFKPLISLGCKRKLLGI